MTNNLRRNWNVISLLEFGCIRIRRYALRCRTAVIGLADTIAVKLTSSTCILSFINRNLCACIRAATNDYFISINLTTNLSNNRLI